MSVFMLYKPGFAGLNQVLMGGGSSTPAAVRVYETEAKAERMRDRYFPNCKIKEVDFP